MSEPTMNGEGLPVGGITTADLYRELKVISDSQIRVEERIRVLPDFEARLRVLERFRYVLMGAAMLGGALSGYVGYLIGHVTIH